ncbi:MAG: gliding motility-associated C-terminal domain-containing protein [Saprospiraceae bacterium]
MKSFYFLFFSVLFSIFLHFETIAQQNCPPPGFPNPGNTCVQAPILCENLDGYCSTINNNNVSQSFPGCPGWTLNNDEWFAFYAGTTQISIEITPSDCQPGNNNGQGLQGAIYRACGPPWVSMDLQCQCTVNPFILESNNFIVGQVYWIVLDGCGGSVCDYEVEVISGSTVGAPPANPGPIAGPMTVCQGQGVNYSIAQVPAATIYTWSMTPSLGTIGSNNNNATVTFTTPGTTELCVSVANACYPNNTPSCKTITVIPTPTATLSGGGVYCANGGDPVELTVTFTGDAPWEFIYRRNGVAQPPIQTSSNPYTFTVTQPGTYTLQSVRSVVGNCPGTVSGSAAITSVTLSPTFAVTKPTCGESTGAINTTPGGGNAPYTFSWSNGASTEDLSNLPPGTYTVTITDNNGCTVVRDVIVEDNLININVTGTVVANTTCNGGNGSIDVSVTPNGTYSYEWSNGATTQDISNLEPGTYTVTVTTGVTCTGAASFTVNDNPNAPQLSATTVQTTCDLENGSINLTVSGGVSPYTFSWSGGQSTEDIASIPAGTYTVTVTGANGCTNTLDVTVNNNNPPFNVSGTVVNNTTCNGGNGSINVSVNPNGNYTYEWAPGGQTTQDISNLPPGTYSITVSAGGSCTETAEFTVEDNPNEPQLNAQTVPTTCDLSNGSVNLSVSGGVAPYTFQWGSGQTTEDISNIPAGTYSVTVSGANGCTAELSVTVDNNNPPININGNVVNNTTCNGGNGSIDISISPNGNYTYQWSPGGQTTQDINNLPPGDYTVTVNGAGSCSETASFTVEDNPNEPQLNATTTESTCDLNNGSINLSVSGGVPPYTFQWGSGQTTEDITGVPAGAYSVTVTGANGCTGVLDVSVDNNNPPFNINGFIQPNTNCNSNNNGSISVAVNPSGNYTYSWSSGQSSSSINNLAPGLYIVTVSAGGSCVEEAAFEVPDEPNPPQLTFTWLDATCNLSNGSINLTVQGGVAPYTYSWSCGQSTQDINNLPPNLYLVTVTGANGCSAEDGVTVDNQIIDITADATILPQTSCLNNNGRITLSFSPNNVTFLWSNNATTPNLNNVGPGLYSVTISAGGSCTQEFSFEVPDEREYPAIDYFTVNPACGFPNGSIDIDPAGGVFPYTYKWSNNAMTQDLSNLAAGAYSVTVTSALGCSSVEFFTLENEVIDILINGTVGDNFSCTAPNGSIDIDIDPTGVNYTYKWSNNLMTQDLFNLAPGIYTVTVTWGSCSAAASFEVLDLTEPPVVSLAVTPATCGLPNGGINLTASGASPPYTFKWSNNATSEDIANLAPGAYTVTVTDFFNCTATASATVGNNNIALNIAGVTQPNTSCAQANGAINITATPTGSPFTYKWSNNATSEDISGLAQGNYTVTVTLGTSCSATAGFTVGNNTVDPEIGAVVTPSICGNPDGAINLTIANGTAPYTFKWSNNAVSEDLTDILAGLYSVTVTDANGCVADTTLDVPNNASTFSLSGLASPLSSCFSNNGAVDLTVTPAGTYTYQWSNNAVSQDISGLPAGTYSVSVTETGNCVASAVFIVTDTRTYPTLNQTVSPEVCDNLNGSIDLSISDGLSPFVFSWSNNSATEDLNNIAAGTYAVTVTGANGCTAATSIVTPANYINFALSASTQPDNSCTLDNGAVNLTVSPADNYTFTWSNSATTEDLANLPSGTYDVTVTLFGSCTATGSYTVGNTTGAPLIAETISPALCGQNSGGINLTISGATTPYLFKWSNNAVTEDLSSVPAGPYSVTVTGANGCSSVKSFLLPDDVIIPSVSGVVNPNTACLNNNGAIFLSVSPALNYTYAWSGGQSTPNLTNIAAGTYTVTVNGGGACISVANFTVPENAGVVALTGTDTDIRCFGANNGAIDLSVSGGTPPYVFNWSPAIPGNPEDPTNLAPATYNVTVTDQVGCSSTRVFVISQPAAALTVNCAQTSSISQPGATDGEAAVNIAGGTAPYTVVWSPGSQQNNVPAGVFPIANLGVGNYAVTVTDANGCVVNCGFAITLVPCVTAIGSMGSTALSLCGDGCLTASYNQSGQFLDPNDVLQFILHEGSGNQIVNEIARSSTPTFCFNPTNMNYGTTYYISAVAGNNNGTGGVLLQHYCTVVSIGTPVAFYDKPVAAIVPPGRLSCAVEQLNLNGSADLPGSTFAWSTQNGQILGSSAQATVTVNQAGMYTLIVTNTLCKDTAIVSVQDLTNQPVASITASPDDILDCKIDEIILAGNIEGTLNANAIWLSNGQVFSNGITLTIDQPGTYQFVILDTLSLCSDTAFVVINENQAFPPLFNNPPGFLNCYSPTTTLSGGSPISGVQFRWASVNGPDTTYLGNGASLNVNAAGTYYLVGFDPVNGCTNAENVTVTADFNYPTAEAGAGFTIDCFGETAYLDGSGSTGPTNMTYQWTTIGGNIAADGNTPKPEINLPGTYTLKVTDPTNGCSDTDQVIIAPNEPQAVVRVSDPPCEGRRGEIVIDTVIGGLPPIRFSFDNGNTFTTQSSFLNLDPGTYNVLVVDAVGCSTTFQAEINPPEPFIVIVDPQIVLELGDSIRLNTQVNVPDNRIGAVLWTPAAGLSCDTCLNPVAKPLTTTQYRVVVKTIEGCEDRAPVLLIVDKRADIYVPNIFSPNGDGENDFLTIYADPKAVLRIQTFQVYSRWGELVHEYYNFAPNNPAAGWNGKFNGQELNPGVFGWYALVELIDGRVVLYEGDVTIKR